MKNTIKKSITIITIFTINIIMNICFVSGQGYNGGGGLFGRGRMAFGNEGSIGDIYNTELGKAINTQLNGEDIDNPLHIGSYWVSGEGEISGLVGTNGEAIQDYNTALDKILKVIQNIVNYALGILGLIALIYLIIHGFMILTAAGDDSKVKKGIKGIKNAFIAIAGIGLSWLIISFILLLINTLTA